VFASIRRYVVHLTPVDLLVERVDQGFAPLISAQSGFVSYELLDCGGGEVITISVFGGAGEAEDSRELARRWADESLDDFEFTLTETLHGQIVVRRAAEALLAPAHPESGGGYTAVRRYQLATGSVRDVMRLADRSLADQIAQLQGFSHYCTIDCGHGTAVSISRFRERSEAEASEQLAAQFVREQSSSFEIERSDWVGGGFVLVAVAATDCLERR
jgi:hypothetical protein